MSDDEYKNLVEWHRSTQRQLAYVGWLVSAIFVFTVINPILQHYGLYNVLGW